MPMFPITSKISSRLTQILLKMPMTPNQITSLGLVFGLLACGFFYSQDHILNILGAILFLVYYILDNCDGEIARYRDLCSNFGKNFDTFVDWIVHSLFFLALGLQSLSNTNQELWLWLGLVCSIGCTINYFCTSFYPTKLNKLSAPFENAPDNQPKQIYDIPSNRVQRLIFIFRQLFRADFCIIVLVLSLIDFEWLLLPVAAIGTQVYWILFFFEDSN